MKALIFENMVTADTIEDYRRVSEIPPTSDDARRTIHEEDNKLINTSIQAFLIKASNLPLGNHFHNKKTEVFFLLEGEVERLLTEASDGSVKKDYRNIPVGSMIVMPPGVAHTFFFAPGSRMLCYSSERFDPDDMIGRKLA